MKSPIRRCSDCLMRTRASANGCKRRMERIEAEPKVRRRRRPRGRLAMAKSKRQPTQFPKSNSEWDGVNSGGAGIRLRLYRRADPGHGRLQNISVATYISFGSFTPADQIQISVSRDLCQTKQFVVDLTAPPDLAPKPLAVSCAYLITSSVSTDSERVSKQIGPSDVNAFALIQSPVDNGNHHALLVEYRRLTGR